ncbi:MAG TPA: Hsp20/alpha crystallin family protein [Gemmatimonadota bacterium]|jgi:HSP20 family protein
MCALRRRLFFEPALSMVGDCVWRPAVDVRRTPTGWLIKAELPGVPAEQVHVTMRGNSVVLSGVRRDVHEEGESCYAMEIAYSPFERRIELPGRVEDADVAISSRDGLLILRIARRATGARTTEKP